MPDTEIRDKLADVDNRIAYLMDEVNMLKNILPSKIYRRRFLEV